MKTDWTAQELATYLWCSARYEVLHVLRRPRQYPAINTIRETLVQSVIQSMRGHMNADEHVNAFMRRYNELLPYFEKGHENLSLLVKCLETQIRIFHATAAHTGLFEIDWITDARPLRNTKYLLDNEITVEFPLATEGAFVYVSSDGRAKSHSYGTIFIPSLGMAATGWKCYWVKLGIFGGSGIPNVRLLAIGQSRRDRESAMMAAYSAIQGINANVFTMRHPEDPYCTNQHCDVYSLCRKRKMSRLANKDAEKKMEI